jgi:hypothetical protein
MKMFARKFDTSLILCMAFCLVLIFSSNFVFGEDIEHELSVDNVHIFYFAKDQTLKVLFALLNTGNTDITVLVENLNTAFSGEYDKHICEIGAGIKAKYKDYKIIQSLYRFDPVTLRPKEGVAINHMVKRRAEDIDPKSALIVRYKISDDFGKRHNVWYGSTDSTPTKMKIIK